MKRLRFKHYAKYLKRDIKFAFKDRKVDGINCWENLNFDCKFRKEQNIINRYGCGWCIKFMVQNFWFWKGCMNPERNKVL